MFTTLLSNSFFDQYKLFTSSNENSSGYCMDYFEDFFINRKEFGKNQSEFCPIANQIVTNLNTLFEKKQLNVHNFWGVEFQDRLKKEWNMKTNGDRQSFEHKINNQV